MQTSSRLNSVIASATSGMTSKAMKLKSKGINVISLSQGEPDFRTPDHICNAAIAAIHSGKYFSYPPTAGYSDLREAIANKYWVENNVHCNPENVLVSNGAKQCLSSTLLAILNPGDEAIVFSPYWVSYEAQVRLAGATPIFLKGEFDANFAVSSQQLEQAITSKTRIVIVCSPCNPTGLVYSRAQIARLAEVLQKHPHVIVISDEVYEYINYTEEKISIASLPGMFERTVTINGFSKGFAMTGWRVGYLVAPQWIVEAVTKLQGHLTSASCSISQRAALCAIQGSRDCVAEMNKEYCNRRDMVFFHLSQIENVRTIKPDGAFYMFPDVSPYFGTRFRNHQIDSSTGFCEFILETAYVSLVPGEAFGEDRCVRLSYADSDQNLYEAVQRIRKSLQMLQ